VTKVNGQDPSPASVDGLGLAHKKAFEPSTGPTKIELGRA